MSNYTVLSEATKALRSVLWEEFSNDPVIQPIVGSESSIVFSNPTETARDSAHRFSLWLYQVTENEHLKNQPALRVSDTQQRPTPLSLDLYFLVTPFATTSDANHLLLGKTMQVMYDNAVFAIRDVDAGVAEELRIIFCRLPLEELTRIWEALKEPYRLSVCYQVKVMRIDSERLTGNERIIERYGDFDVDPTSHRRVFG